MISKCPLSVLKRCPPYREFGYSKMAEKWQGPSPGVRLIEVSVKRELTVSNNGLFTAYIFTHKKCKGNGKRSEREARGVGGRGPGAGGRGPGAGGRGPGAGSEPSSLTILSQRSTFEEKYQKIEGCEQSNQINENATLKK